MGLLSEALQGALSGLALCIAVVIYNALDATRSYTYLYSLFWYPRRKNKALVFIKEFCRLLVKPMMVMIAGTVTLVGAALGWLGLPWWGVILAIIVAFFAFVIVTFVYTEIVDPW